MEVGEQIGGFTLVEARPSTGDSPGEAARFEFNRYENGTTVSFTASSLSKAVAAVQSYIADQARRRVPVEPVEGAEEADVANVVEA